MKARFILILLILNYCVLFSQTFVYDRVDFPGGWTTYKFNDTIVTPMPNSDSIEATNELQYFYPQQMVFGPNKKLVHNKVLLGEDSVYVNNLTFELINDTVYFIDTLTDETQFYYGIYTDTAIYFYRYYCIWHLENQSRSMSVVSTNSEIIPNNADTVVPKFDSSEDSLSFCTIRTVLKQTDSDCIPGYAYMLKETINFGDSLQVGDSVFYNEGNYTIPLLDKNGCDSIIKLHLKVAHNALNHDLEYGEVIDIEGNVYKTIQIGTQLWMAENLRVTKYNNGGNIPLVTGDDEWNDLDTPGYCWYENDSVTYSIPYGALYNWYVVETNNICPTGWHVPMVNEGVELINSLIESGFNYDNSLTENKIAKSVSSSIYWDVSTNEGAVGNNDYPEKQNITGFSAVPGGYRMPNHNSFDYNGDVGFWWTSTECGANDGGCNEGTDVWLYSISYNYPDVMGSTHLKSVGYSIRCIKDSFTDAKAGFSANVTSGERDLEVSFTDNSTGDITSWSWDFGDETTSTEQNPVHTYANTGTYTVSLTVTGASGIDTETKMDYITIALPVPIADFTANVTSGERDLEVSFTDNSTGDITSWLWGFGDETTSTEQNPVHTYTNTGTYTVSLTVTGASGTDMETKTDYITINAPTGIFDLTTDNNTIIFPNPSKTTCTIKIPNEISGKVELKIISSNGEVLFYKRGIKDKSYDINLSELKNGFYYISIISEIETKTQKLIISR